jgi:hypothetical protein
MIIQPPVKQSESTPLRKTLIALGVHLEGRQLRNSLQKVAVFGHLRFVNPVACHLVEMRVDVDEVLHAKIFLEVDDTKQLKYTFLYRRR